MFVLLSPVLLIAGLVLILRFIRKGRNTLSRLSHLPWVGLEKSTVLGLLRCRFRNATKFSAAVKEAFDRYSSKDEACVIPILTAEFVALPPSELEWIISQPDHILNAKTIQEEALQTKWTTVDPFIMENSLHRDLIKRDLTRRLGDLTSDIIDELASSIDEEWGVDTENWKEVVPFETLMRVIARTSNRVFVGLPLCRNPVLLENGKGFATQLPLSALILGQIPNWIRPALAKIVTYKGKKHAAKFIDCVRPTVLARQAALNEHDSEKVSQPNDFLQWLVTAASLSNNPRQNDPFIIGGRLLNVNFGAIHTSTFSITNAIFDLASPPSSQQVISELRDEANSVLAANNEVWTKQGLAQLVKTDSALRESSRLGSFLAVGLIRKVLAPEGLMSPISKTFLPQGSRVCVLTSGIHTSESNYVDALTYKPFRFSNIRSAPSAASSGSTDTKGDTLVPEVSPSTSDDSSDPPPPYTETPKTHLPPAAAGAEPTPLDSYLSRASLSFVTTSPTYHPFGHGRHACPGRFFAANELKLLLAYLVLNYDFEMLETRPANKWLSTTILPPMKEKIRVRRRKC